MHAVTVPGRWAWGVSGLLAAAALAIPGARLIASEKSPWNTAEPSAVTVRTVAVTQPVTSLLVQSYGGRVRVAAGQVSHVRVTERIVYEPKAGPPAVAESVSGGRLSLGDPACAQADCAVDFSVTVPSAVSVTVDTQGGPAVISAVSGVSGTTVDSGGGPVQVTQVTGPLTVRTGGGPLIMNDVAGPIRAGTSGGVLTARGVTAATASLSTGGGPAQVVFSAAPDTVTLSTSGGPATLRLPGGPYALTADSDGGPELIGIATDPAARASIRVTSGGGPILVAPPSGSGSVQPPSLPSVPGGAN
ncbi:MAG TPA: hypothetical protein VF204_24420 [Streptosporangiaceae bacterium]